VYLDDGGRLVVSPSDLVGYLGCEHLTELSLAVVRGTLSPPLADDPEIEVVQRRGMEHEAMYLAELQNAGFTVVEVTDRPLETAVEHTLEALRAGASVVYQAAFFHTGIDGGPAWRGHADFLTRVEVPSALGEFSYEPEDTKLAQRVKPSAVLQLCEYAEQLARLQGGPPEQIHVVLGGSHRVSLRLADFSAYFRMTKRRFEEALRAAVETYPLPVEHCAVCAWRVDCDNRRLLDGHLTIVAGLGMEQARKLQAQGIANIGQLADSTANTIPKMSTATFDKLRDQARLQVAATARPDVAPPYELLRSPGPGLGLAALPLPSPGDVFFDIESDPFAQVGGLEYLFGVGWIAETGEFCYRAFWAHSAAEEKSAFEDLIDFLTERRGAYPDMHVYHYAAYEPSALGRLMGRHGTREDEIDDLLRRGVLVDLFRIVRQSVRVGTPSYSLKKLEALYMPARTEAITDGGSSIVEYERWIETHDPTILDELAAYNEVDCDSTRRLRDWLDARRAEYVERFEDLPAPVATEEAEVPDGIPAGVLENVGLRLALSELGAQADPSDPRAYAMWLLGELLEWHRREDKPEWWRYFDRVLCCEEEDLFDDTEAVAGLEYAGVVETVKKSLVHRYRFDPTQEHKLASGQTWVNPAAAREQLLGGTGASGPGETQSVDPVQGIIDLKRGISSDAPHPRCLVPPGPLPNPRQREAIQKVVRSVIEHGVDGNGPFRAVRDVLQRHAPRLRGVDTAGPLRRPGEDSTVGAIRLMRELDHGCLAVQGPPGSGKTRLAARAIVALVHEGHKVAITANSHAVISNLLREVVELAEQAGVALHASQKAGDGREVDHPSVTQRGNEGMEADLEMADVFAGTAWLFTRPAFEGRVDYLVVEEAGQLSLANVVAVGICARNLVLLGDPMQLAQPSKGSHPLGADVSALTHLLGEHETMPDDLGVFLPTTHRLHPDICDYISGTFYEGRLHSEPSCERQAIGGEGELRGSGLRWYPVPHVGNRTSSSEEVTVVQRLCQALLGQPWTDKAGVVRPLRVDDILVVTPYNAQVSLLAEGLPVGLQIGTVDKFQGRQAPVVIVSMATSTADDAPRGLDFLFSRNRLNVAVSRAQALAVIVASPSLLSTRCRTVDQMRLVNSLCRFAEMAELGHSGSS
jgi:predicted RecB family nuclease